MHVEDSSIFVCVVAKVVDNAWSGPVPSVALPIVPWYSLDPSTET